MQPFTTFAVRVHRPLTATLVSGKDVAM